MSETDLPDTLRSAGADYLRDDDDDALRRLVESFGPFSRRNEAHRRATWLCLLAAQRMVTSPSTPFDSHASEDHRTIAAIRLWIEQGIAPDNWDRICNRTGIVHHPGELSSDEDTQACAICALARFALHFGVWDAVEAIEGACLLELDSRTESSGNMTFCPWLVHIALPAAWHLRDLSGRELRPRRLQV